METPQPTPQIKRRIGPAAILLILPYLGLCFPQFYTRATPTLLGFPFFYWYQFAWVILTSALLGVFYHLTKPTRAR
jgi:hypothetical protein